MRDERTPDRYSTILGDPCAIMQPLGEPKPRELCQPFTYTFSQPHDSTDVRAQEKFVSGLAKLNKPKRAKRVKAPA